MSICETHSKNIQIRRFKNTGDSNLLSHKCLAFRLIGDFLFASPAFEDKSTLLDPLLTCKQTQKEI